MIRFLTEEGYVLLAPEAIVKAFDYDGGVTIYDIFDERYDIPEGSVGTLFDLFMSCGDDCEQFAHTYPVEEE